MILTPAADVAAAKRTAAAVVRELEAGLPGFTVTVARSRHATDPADLHRAGAEALLAANVAEARGLAELSFEETGAYRLLLPAMSEDPTELEGFFDETVAPLVAYDEQYETELVRTLETFLDADGNVAGTAERLFTHRHTIRYRLERVKELTSLDVGSTDGRERLSLGLKAMRVLGIVPPGRPGPRAGRRGRAGCRGSARTASALRVRDAAAGVPGLDDEMVGRIAAEADHDELGDVGAKQCMPGGPRRRSARASVDLLGAPGHLRVAPCQSAPSEALWMAKRGSRRRSSALTARHMLPKPELPVGEVISMPLIRGEPSRRSVASVLCLLASKSSRARAASSGASASISCQLAMGRMLHETDFCRLLRGYVRLWRAGERGFEPLLDIQSDPCCQVTPPPKGGLRIGPSRSAGTLEPQ